MKTIIVTNDIFEWLFLANNVEVMTANHYLSGHYHGKHRVINLCSTYKHQSLGYYVSLLALARGHKVLPDAKHIQTCLNTKLGQQLSVHILKELDDTLSHLKSSRFKLSIYFGHSVDKKYNKLAHKLYRIFNIPLLEVNCLKIENEWEIASVKIKGIKNIPHHHLDFVKETAKTYVNNGDHPYNLAIYVDPTKSNAPSNKEAINRFIKAGNKYGFNVDIITKHDANIITDYDALFIRAGTSVNHHTYRMSRKAEQEGLIVIDDSESIVKCANKVYLAELFANNNIRCPKTSIISCSYAGNELPKDYPCIVKLPDSSFSKGVKKANDVEELEVILREFFLTSELVIIQEFMPTTYDYRIGIIDNKVIYACKYHMAAGHWQIFNWTETSQNKREGNNEIIPIDDVPIDVIDLAFNATKLIGSGLYGVDVKYINGKAYIIEINDNPSIDHGIEDKYYNVYDEIMKVFSTRVINRYNG